VKKQVTTILVSLKRRYKYRRYLPEKKTGNNDTRIVEKDGTSTVATCLKKKQATTILVSLKKAVQVLH
jgi:hypothetical protein